MIDFNRSIMGLVLAVMVVLCACRPTSSTEPVRAPESPEETGKAAEQIEASSPSFDYPGGWLDGSTCVDICGVTAASPIDRPSAVVCFDSNDPDCTSKTGVADYDYLMLSQHWLPTVCHGLESGYDSTVTQQAGAQCAPDAPNRLTVHGLWPNYKAGFPQCCGSAMPLDPELAMEWPSELRTALQEHQPDPTTSSFQPALCQIFNHEWQKHGTCFVDTGDTNADAKKYFETGLELSRHLEPANSQLDAWAGTTQSRSAIEALYLKAVQVMCDSRQPERLLEIHTCWSREMERVDCPYSKGFGALRACGEEVSFPRLDDVI